MNPRGEIKQKICLEGNRLSSRIVRYFLFVYSIILDKYEQIRYEGNWNRKIPFSR